MIGHPFFHLSLVPHLQEFFHDLVSEFVVVFFKFVAEILKFFEFLVGNPKVDVGHATVNPIHLFGSAVSLNKTSCQCNLNIWPSKYRELSFYLVIFYLKQDLKMIGWVDIQKLEVENREFVLLSVFDLMHLFHYINTVLV